MNTHGCSWPLRLLVLWCGCLAAAGLHAQVDYRYYQAPVQTAPDSAHTCGCAVAGMLANFAGVPSDLDGQAWEEALGGREDLATGLQILSARGIRSVSAPEGQGAQPLGDAVVVRTGAATGNPIQLKAWLDQGLKGVVVRYRAPLPLWNAVKGADTVIHMDAAMQVQAGTKVLRWKKAVKKFPDLSKGLADSSLRLVPRSPAAEMGEQAVLVVGYDSLRGVLVKHCRGKAWGQGGYAWVDWDYHRYMALEAAVVLLAKPTAPPRTRQSKQPLAIRLKCLPELLEGQRHLQLSVWIAAGGVDRPWKSLRYAVEWDGQAVPLALKPLAFADAVDGGYSVYLPMKGLPERFRVRVYVDEADAQGWLFQDVGWAHGDFAGTL